MSLVEKCEYDRRGEEIDLRPKFKHSISNPVEKYIKRQLFKSLLCARFNIADAMIAATLMLRGNRVWCDKEIASELHGNSSWT